MHIFGADCNESKWKLIALPPFYDGFKRSTGVRNTIHDEVKKTKVADKEYDSYKNNEQELPFTSSAIETKNSATPVIISDETMTIRYQESE